MKTYVFFFKNDHKKEPIDSFKTTDIEKAQLYFASIKRMSLYDFLRIYSVKEK